MAVTASRRGANYESSPRMIREIVDGPISWVERSLPDDAGFVSVTPTCRSEILRAAEVLAANPLPLLALKPDNFPMPACRTMMRHVREILDHGVGFALIDRLPMNELGRDLATALFWLLGTMVAPAVAQKWDGTIKYDVRDTGGNTAPGSGVRSSITNEGQEFHTDNSYNLPPDYVALLCLQPAMEGGIDSVVSLQTAHNTLLQIHPELLARLYGQFCFDRQMEHAPHDPHTVARWPVFHYGGKTLKARLANGLIFGGHEISGEALDDLGRHAIDTLTSVIEAPGMSRESAFEAGHIQFVDNHRLGHRRTAFRDWPETERRRHLVRLWFRTSGRPFYSG